MGSREKVVALSWLSGCVGCVPFVVVAPAADVDVISGYVPGSVWGLKGLTGPQSLTGASGIEALRASAGSPHNFATPSLSSSHSHHPRTTTTSTTSITRSSARTSQRQRAFNLSFIIIFVLTDVQIWYTVTPRSVNLRPPSLPTEWPDSDTAYRGIPLFPLSF